MYNECDKAEVPCMVAGSMSGREESPSSTGHGAP